MNLYSAIELLRKEAERLEESIDKRKAFYDEDVLRLEAEHAAIELTMLRLDDIRAAIEKLKEEL